MPFICQSLWVLTPSFKELPPVLCKSEKFGKRQGLSQTRAGFTFLGSPDQVSASGYLQQGHLSPTQFTNQSLKSAIWWPRPVMWLALKSLTAKCKMRSLHFCPWKLVNLFCYIAVPPLQDREVDEEAECCQARVGENVYWFLLSYKGAQSIEEQLLVFAAFHIPHETKGPTPTSLWEAGRGTAWSSISWVPVATMLSRPTAGSPNTLGHQHLPCLWSSTFPLWADVSSSILEKKEERDFGLNLPLSGSTQRVKELMFIKCSAFQRKTMDKTLGVVMAHSRPHFQGS